MAIVVNGATYDSTSLVTVSGAGQYKLVFRCVRGLYDSPEVRGTDTVIPGTAGRTIRTRIRDRRIIELEGEVYGVGSTDATQQADVETSMEALRTLFSPTRAVANLVIATSTGSKTIPARPINMVIAERTDPVHVRVSVELEAVGADWS